MSQENELQDVLSHTVKDNALVQLVYMANIGVSSGITLMLEGHVIYGDLMSGKDYALQTAENIRDGSGDSTQEVRNAVAKTFDDLADIYRNEPGYVIPLNYLHLKNAAHLNADGTTLQVNNTMFRISIEKVSGFAIGRPSY